MTGLGGSQKGEVVWLRKWKREREIGNPGCGFGRVDVWDLIINEGLQKLVRQVAPDRWTTGVCSVLVERVAVAIVN
jgi:hypothetical protein